MYHDFCQLVIWDIISICLLTYLVDGNHIVEEIETGIFFDQPYCRHFLYDMVGRKK